LRSIPPAFSQLHSNASHHLSVRASHPRPSSSPVRVTLLTSHAASLHGPNLSWPTRSSRDTCGCTRSGWARWRGRTTRARLPRSNRTVRPEWARRTTALGVARRTDPTRRHIASPQGRRQRRPEDRRRSRRPGSGKSGTDHTKRPRTGAGLRPWEPHRRSRVRRPGPRHPWKARWYPRRVHRRHRSRMRRRPAFRSKSHIRGCWRPDLRRGRPPSCGGWVGPCSPRGACHVPPRPGDAAKRWLLLPGRILPSSARRR